MSATPLLGVINDWPLWVQVLASAVVALMWLTFLTWVINLFKRESKSLPAGSIQAQTESPGATQQLLTDGGGIDVGGDVAGGDIDKSTHITFAQTTVPEPHLIAPIVEGHVNGNRITLSVRNTDSVAHQFKSRLYAVEGGVGDIPKIADHRFPVWLRWDSASATEWEVIGPKQEGTVKVAQAEGHSTGSEASAFSLSD